MTQDQSHFEFEMERYIDEDERAEREAIEAEGCERSEEQEITKKEFKDFTTQLEQAREILVKEGQFAGLCRYCLGTDKLVISTEDGYEGLQYKIDNELPTLFKCQHGRSIEEMGLGF